MAYDRDTSSLEMVEAINAIAYAGRNALNWAALWRAVGEYRQEEYERRQDRDYDFTSRPHFDNVLDRPVATPRETPEALQIEINGILLNSVVRMSTAWQNLLENEMPELRSRLEDFQSDDDPSPQVRNALIDQVRIFFQVLSRLVRDQGNVCARDVMALQERLLPYPKSEKPV